MSSVVIALIDWDYPLAGTNLFSYGRSLSTVSGTGRLDFKAASQSAFEKMEINWEKEQHIHFGAGLV